MSGVGRYVKFTAQPGRGDELAQLLLRAAESLIGTPGCELYLVSRSSSDPHINLEDVEDMAPRFGLGEQSEARFATRPLGAVRTGVSHQRLRPRVRQAFGHRHTHAEEIVLILARGGRVKIDDEVRELKPRDAIRFAPGSTRAFEAGPDGLEFVVFGPHHRGDAVMDQDFWPTETAPQ